MFIFIHFLKFFGPICDFVKIVWADLGPNGNGRTSGKMCWSATHYHNWAERTMVVKLKVWNTFLQRKEKNSTKFVVNFFDPKLKFVQKIVYDGQKMMN